MAYQGYVMNKSVLVTSIGSDSGISVIKRLKNEGYRVIGCNCYPKELVVASRIVDVFYRVPKVNEKGYKALIEQICNKEKIRFVIPLTDLDVDWLSDNFEYEKKWGCVFCISDRSTIRLCRNKKKLSEFCDNLKSVKSIPCIEIENVLKQNEYPYICKPVCGRSSEGIYYLRNKKDLEYYFDKIIDGYVIQPYIEGNIYCADVIRDPKTSKVVVVVREELIRTIKGLGVSVVVKRDYRIEEASKELVDFLKIKGCVNFEFIKDRDNNIYLLDCNPRFSGGIEFSCKAGYNMINNSMRIFGGTSEGIDDFIIEDELYFGKVYEVYETC